MYYTYIYFLIGLRGRMSCIYLGRLTLEQLHTLTAMLIRPPQIFYHQMFPLSNKPFLVDYYVVQLPQKEICIGPVMKLL